MSKRNPPEAPPAPISVQYSDAQIAFVVAARLGGAPWADVAKAFRKEFPKAPAVNDKQCSGVFRRHAASALSSPHGSGPHPFEMFTRAGIGDRVGRNTKDKALFFVTAASPVNRHSPRKAGHDNHDVRGNLFSTAWESVLSLKEHRGAIPIILPLPAHLPSPYIQGVSRAIPPHYDPELWPWRGNFYTDYTFCENLRARELYLLPQQLRPLTGLRRIRGRRNTDHEDLRQAVTRLPSSMIYASSKQDMEAWPTGNATMPRILQLSAAVSMPEYLPNRIGAVAEEEHVLGGIIVEVDGPRFFHRQVRFSPDGSFVYLSPRDGSCMRYFPDRPPAAERACAMKIGDNHPGWDDPVAIEHWLEVIAMAKPPYIHMEDWFDCGSINPHIRAKVLDRLAQPACFASLEAECAMAADWYADFRRRVKKVSPDSKLVFTESNHPNWIYGYFNSGDFMKDTANTRKAVELLHHFLQTGEHPLRRVVDPGGEGLWPDATDDFYVEGVQMNVHGHLGIGGMKGSMNQTEMAYHDVMDAHGHGGSIRGQHYRVGHSTITRKGFNKGPLRDLLCSGLVFRGGAKCLVISVGNAWHG